ncbi:AGE family epimerase/isomerase [Peribacillus kribbensis]|uniref:AGE family epimerase/isomerase n=1 Tax=Peribacillus kribbensis TaxID=356658 RepID=UPI0003FD2EB6|nr:AGE family epimerase/isomerase [Peribacillus kribbensis]
MCPAGILIKNYWVQDEVISAASLLAAKTQEPFYWECYDEMFAYCNKYFIDHTYDGWYQLLDRQNQPYSQKKSPPPKTDYHPVAACYQTILAFS